MTNWCVAKEEKKRKKKHFFLFSIRLCRIVRSEASHSVEEDSEGVGTRSGQLVGSGLL